MRKRAGRKKGMRKAYKIVLAVFLVFVIFAVGGLSVIFLDLASYTATGTQVFTPKAYPTGSEADSALIVYDPGLTGAAKNIADKMAIDLQTQGYYIDVAGIKSSTATSDINQYQLIVVGGPIYGGKAASSVQSYLSNLNPQNGTIVGVYGVGSFGTENDKIAPLPSGSSLSIKETLKISTSQNATAESAVFVTQLLK